MSDESTLHKKAREVITAGKLPNRRPDRTWGGPGVGDHCPICGTRVKRDEIELEVEFARNDDESGPENYHVHIRCFAAWESERENLEHVTAARRSTDQALPAAPGTARGPSDSASDII